jgi:DnaJ-class molecular chaperone
MIAVECPTCRGRGVRGIRPCPLCDGDKTIRVYPLEDEDNDDLPG